MSDSQVHSPKGTHDILPHDHEFHTYVKKVIRHRARQSGFRRITTPVLESVDLYKRSLGEDSDVFRNELYIVDDKEGGGLVLKPDGTPGVVRSYLENEMEKWPQPVLLYYFDPQFRYHGPKDVRNRQYWQVGFEILGESDAALDAQLVLLANKIHKDLGIDKSLIVQVNTIGTAESREKYLQSLQDYYAGKERSLCESCIEKLTSNPLMLLDCKEEDCQILAQLAPVMQDYLDKESLAYHEEFKSYLDEIGIEYEDNPKLVRGLQYYSKTVFEFWQKGKGASSSLGGGGRYDELAGRLGGKPVAGVGYAAVIEKIIAAMKREKIKVPSKDAIHVFVAQLGVEAKRKCIPLIDELHEAGIKAMGAVGKGSINVQLDLANAFKVPFTVLVGITEVREGTAIIRHMDKGTQETVKMGQVVGKLVKLIGEDNLDKYSPGELLYS